MPRVTSLFIYPIKSCRATELARAKLDLRGLRDDRRWMIVDEDGTFLTQREHPELARVIPQLHGDILTIMLEGSTESVRIPRDQWDPHDAKRRRQVQVWSHRGSGICQGEEAADFFSSLLEKRVSLVFMPDSEVRAPKRRPEGVDARMSFADGYPILLTSMESLDAVNDQRSAGSHPVSMDRFRPNIVVAGCAQPWDEDFWREFSICSIPFYGVKPCARCSIPQVDQHTGIRSGKEPAATLARLRREGNEVLFGMNLIHARPGSICIGASVDNIIRGPRPPT